MDPIIQVGKPAPSFQLPDLHGENHSLEELRGWIAVLNFWSAECTWCERVDRELMDYMQPWENIAKVWWIASNANDTPDYIAKVAGERKLAMLLLDTQQQVAELYGAQTTPHFFVVDQNGILAYQGAWDDITFRQRVATRVHVPKVIESLANHQTVELTHSPPYGCVLVRSFEGHH